MDNLRKYLAIVCTSAIGVLCIVLLFKSAGCRRHASIGEKTLEGLEETARESINVLNSTIAQIRNAFKH